MDDRRKEEAGKPSTERRFVTERELLRVLDEILWQVERRRVNPEEPPAP
jgi:hypothetical protein